mgnify:CR=1 FL=1
MVCIGAERERLKKAGGASERILPFLGLASATVVLALTGVVEARVMAIRSLWRRVAYLEKIGFKGNELVLQSTDPEAHSAFLGKAAHFASPIVAIQ